MALQITPGRKGAKRQSFAALSPREVLFRIVAENPRKSEQQVMDMCYAAVRHNSEHMDAIFQYWFANNYRAVVYEATPQVSAQVRQQAAERAAKAKEVAAKVEQLAMNLLNHMLSSGKRIAEATGKDMTAEGGWMAEVGKIVGPKNIVGKKMSARDLLKVRLKYINER